MINGIVNGISTPAFQNLIQNTVAQVSIETGLKAVGRPLFTLADKNVDKETRKYSATKELLYQILCLGIYLAVIPPVFKKGGFKLFKKMCEKAQNTEGLLKTISTKGGKSELFKCSVNEFKNEKGILSIYKLGDMTKAERAAKENEEMVKKAYQTIRKSVTNEAVAENIINKIKESEKGDDFFRQFYMAKGGIEMSSIAGSVIGLTVLAPEISHLILHPVMHALGMDAPQKDAQPKDVEQKLDTKA